jgi:hypothetical protein
MDRGHFLERIEDEKLSAQHSKQAKNRAREREREIVRPKIQVPTVLWCSRKAATTVCKSNLITAGCAFGSAKALVSVGE